MQQPIVIRTLGDLTDGDALYGACDDCFRVETLDVGALLARLGSEITFADLCRRLRCTACGSRNAHLMHGWEEYPFSYPAPSTAAKFLTPTLRHGSMAPFLLR